MPKQPVSQTKHALPSTKPRPAPARPAAARGIARPGRTAAGRRKPVALQPRPTWTLRRVLLLVLLILPAWMVVQLLRQPPAADSWFEIAFYAFGVPIVVVNLWEWASVKVLDRPVLGNTKGNSRE